MWLALLLMVAPMDEVEIQIPLLRHQIDFLKADSFFLALVGGYGSGKSSACALKAVTQSQKDPGILHAVMSPSFPTAKLTIIPSVFEVLEDWMGFSEGRDFTYNRVEHMFTFRRWPGQLVILSGENKNKGPNLGSCGIDEPGLHPHESFKQAIARVRHPQAQHPCIYLTGTPEDMNWFQEVVEGDLRPKDMTDIRARTRDNIFLSETYFRNLEESYSAEELAAYTEGRFVNLSGALAYHAFGPGNVIRAEDFTPDKELPLLIGFDYNWFPNTAVIAQEVPDWVDNPGDEPRKALIIFDEVWIRGSTEEKCSLILERFPGFAEYLIYQDATGDRMTSVGVSDLNQVRNSFRSVPHRILFRPGNPKRIDRLNAMNGRLCNGKGERFVLATDNCRHLIADLKRSNREEFLSGKYKDPERGHVGDAAGYMVEYRYPIRRQITHYNRMVIT